MKVFSFLSLILIWGVLGAFSLDQLEKDFLEKLFKNMEIVDLTSMKEKNYTVVEDDEKKLLNIFLNPVERTVAKESDNDAGFLRPRFLTPSLMANPRFRKSIRGYWDAMNALTNLIFVEDWRYIQNILLNETTSGFGGTRLQIWQLERKLNKSYNDFKLDVLKTVANMRLEFKLEISKRDLEFNKVLELEQMYLTKLKSQINAKDADFTQNVKNIVQQYRDSLLPVENFTTTSRY